MLSSFLSFCRDVSADSSSPRALWFPLSQVPAGGIRLCDAVLLPGGSGSNRLYVPGNMRLLAVICERPVRVLSVPNHGPLWIRALADWVKRSLTACFLRERFC